MCYNISTSINQKTKISIYYKQQQQQIQLHNYSNNTKLTINQGNLEMPLQQQHTLNIPKVLAPKQRRFLTMQQKVKRTILLQHNINENNEIKVPYLINEEEVLNNIHNGSFNQYFLFKLEKITDKELYIENMAQQLQKIYFDQFLGQTPFQNFFNNITIRELQIPKENFNVKIIESNVDYRKNYMRKLSLTEDKLKAYTIHHLSCIKNNNKLQNLVAIKPLAHINVHNVINELQLLGQMNLQETNQKQFVSHFKQKKSKSANNTFTKVLTNILNANADLSEALALKQKDFKKIRGNMLE